MMFLCAIRAVNRRLLLQMAVPCLKLACNAWHFRPAGGAVDRSCPFCGCPATDSLTHCFQRTAMFDMVQDVLPRLAWASSKPVRVLERCGVGADAPRRVLVGTVLDGLWAALVARTRTSRSARGAFEARLDAMARLSPHLATVLNAMGPVPVSAAC